MNDLPVFIPCAYEPCTRQAVTRLRLKAGWENLCIHHYDRYFQQEADDFCRAQGLTTQAEKMAWINARIGKIGNPTIQREPGQDDEEMAA